MNSNSNSKSSLFGNEDDNSINIREVVFQYLRFWRWFVLSIIVFILLGAFIYMSSDRVYVVSSSILLKEEKGTAGSKNGSSLGSLESLGLLSTTNNIDNEIAVLTSPNQMKEVVSTLNLQTSYYQKGIFRDTEIYKACPYIIRLMNISPDSLNGQVEVIIRGHETDATVSGEYKVGGNSYEIVSQTVALPAEVELPQGLGKLFIGYREGKVAAKDETYIAQIRNTLSEAYRIVGRIQIAPITKQSSVLSLKLNTSNTAKGTDILNGVVKIYNRYNAREDNEMAVNTSKFIDERLGHISEELKQVETEVVNYKKSHGIADIESESKYFMDQTSELEKQRIEIETQLKTIELVEDFTKNPSNKTKPIPNLTVTDPGLSAVIAQYNALLISYSDIVRSTSENNPASIRAYETLNTMRQGIQVSVDNVKRSLNITKRELDRQSSTISSRIKSVPAQAQGLLEIMRQQQIKQSLYLYLLQLSEETNITIASTSDKAKVITDPIASSAPIEPKRDVILLACLMLGVLIPILIIFIRSKMQTTISSREELEKITQLSIIGEIMKKEEDTNIVVEANKTTAIVELFRTLRNNIQFILSSPEQKVVLVTSTIPGEGKTFISINIAASFTLSDKKVLLIGMDIRNPKLANDMDFPKGAGLTSYLAGDEADWRTLIYKPKQIPNLDIMQAGAIPPNPNELLMKPTLKKMIEEAKSEYDIVIIDSAPIGVVSDTFLIAGLADTTIYVSREDVTPKQAMSFVNEVYGDKKLPNMYLVFNGVELSKNKGRYGYGYTYGYGLNKKHQNKIKP